jgi:ABC-type branched-subunit amino acid transport system substrate-binding protein
MAVLAATLAGKGEKGGSRHTVAMVADTRGDGPSYAAAFTAEMRSAGVDALEPVEFDSVAGLDASAQVNELVERGADVVVIATAGKACPSTVALRPDDVQLVVSQECAPEAILSQAGSNAIGVWTVRSALDPRSAGSASKAEVDSFLSATDSIDGAVADGIVEIGWDQAALLVEALRAAPELNRAAVVDTMRGLPTRGPADVGLHAGEYAVGEGPVSQWVLDSAAVQRFSEDGWVNP